MQEKKILFSRLLFVICFSIGFYLFFSRIGIIYNFILNVLKILSPVIMGFVFAFVINIPMSAIEKLIYKIFPNKKKKSKNVQVEVEPTSRKIKLIRMFSLILTFALLYLLIRGLILFVIPQLTETINTLTENIPMYFEKLKTFAYDVRDELHIPKDTIDEVINSGYKTVTKYTKNVADYLPTVIKTTQNITSGIFDFIMSLIMAIYVLSSKEKLARIIKKITYAVCNEKYAKKVVKITELANKTFTAFTKGQILEACIIGILCYVGMLVFKLDYALLISVITGVTALIPIFGAFIGGGLGTILLLTISPIKSLWFIVFIIVLQQLEGNLIYPKVVGTSIGISGLWVLIALTLGGAIAGIPGILVGIPLFATAYELIREYVDNKLEEKKLNIE